MSAITESNNNGFPKCNKIRHIVRLRQMLRRWRNKAALAQRRRTPTDVPSGHIAVTVGSNSRRFVVRASHLNHPLMRKLLSQSEDEFGFVNQIGPLNIPCDEQVFEDILRFLNRSDGRFVNLEDFQRSSYCRTAITDSRPLLETEKSVWETKKSLHYFRTKKIKICTNSVSFTHFHSHSHPSSLPSSSFSLSFLSCSKFLEISLSLRISHTVTTCSRHHHHVVLLATLVAPTAGLPALRLLTLVSSTAAPSPAGCDLCSSTCCEFKARQKSITRHFQICSLRRSFTQLKAYLYPLAAKACHHCSLPATACHLSCCSCHCLLLLLLFSLPAAASIIRLVFAYSHIAYFCIINKNFSEN